MTHSPLPAARFAFVAEALDRADHVRDQPDALAALWPAARVVCVDADGRAACDAEGGLFSPDATRFGAMPDGTVFLGMAGGIGWFGRATTAAELPEAGEWIDLRTAAARWPARDSTAFAQARAVLHWQSRHRHCGVCGGALVVVRAGWLGRCTQCGLEHYPRTDPAVIVAITDGERLLLGRQASWPPRRYSTLAGFVEPGETLEQAVAREVMEEAGVRIRSARYLASQPWPFPSSLMLGFIAEAEPDVPQANDELEDARWFTRDEVGAALRGETREAGLLLSPSVSISRWLIECWHAGA